MRILAIMLVSASLLGCSDALSSIDMLVDELPLAEQSLSSRPSARRVAAIDTSLVAILVRARVSEAFEMSVLAASGGCRSSATTVVTVGELTATIVPHQRVSTAPDIACPANFFIERRTVRISFTQRGAARVRLVSRSGADQRLLAVERPVTVE